MTLRVVTICATVAVLSACTATEPGCFDICTIWSTVRGTVTDSVGSPVPEAMIELRLMADGPGAGGELTCQAPPGDEFADVVFTDEAGTFSALLDATSLSFPECVQVSTTPPPETGLGPGVDTVLVRWSFDEATAPVTVVDIVLN